MRVADKSILLTLRGIKITFILLHDLPIIICDKIDFIV
jgi:hypothetical protein